MMGGYLCTLPVKTQDQAEKTAEYYEKRYRKVIIERLAKGWIVKYADPKFSDD